MKTTHNPVQPGQAGTGTARRPDKTVVFVIPRTLWGLWAWAWRSRRQNMIGFLKSAMMVAVRSAVKDAAARGKAIPQWIAVALQDAASEPGVKDG